LKLGERMLKHLGSSWKKKNGKNLTPPRSPGAKAVKSGKSKKKKGLDHSVVILTPKTRKTSLRTFLGKKVTEKTPGKKTKKNGRGHLISVFMENPGRGGKTQRGGKTKTKKKFMGAR